MGSFSDYAENAFINHVLGVSTWSPPTIYVGLSTSDPLDTALGIAEPIENNYGRIAHSNWKAAANRAISNRGSVIFNQASDDWGDITHYIVCDHATNTNWGTDVNLISHGILYATKSIVAGNRPSFAEGELEISVLGGSFTTYLINKMLDHIFGVTYYSPPTIAIGVSNTTPTDAGANITEPLGNNYARVTGVSWASASGGASSNSSDITFNTPSGSWGLITNAMILDHATNIGWGDNVNLLMYGSVNPQDPDSVVFPAGYFNVSLS